MNLIKRFLGFVWGIVEVLIIVYVVFITSCILMRNKFGFTQFDSYTWVSIKESTAEYVVDSKPGNLLIVKNEGIIKEGDVIYYYAPVNEEYVVYSGVVKSLTKGTDTSLYYLDDNDKTTVPSTRVLGKYANQHENYGQVLDVLESRFGFLLLVLLPIMIVFIFQIYQFFCVMREEKEYNEKNKDNNNDKSSKNEKTKDFNKKEEKKSVVIPDDDVEVL